MKIIDFLKEHPLPANINSNGHYINGKMLIPAVDFIEQCEPFIGSKIEVIEEIIEVGNPKLVATNTSISIEGSIIEPTLITLKHVDGMKFNENVKLYSINLDTTIDGEEVVSYRCTPDSIKIPQ